MNFKVYDGHTAKSINQLLDRPEAWTYITGGEDQSEIKVVQANVPWLYRGVSLIGSAVANVPFSIYRGNTEVTSSEDWEDPTGLFPDVKRLLMQISMSLTMYNYAYAEVGRNKFGYEKGLYYLHPLSITPKIDKNEGLVHFKRKVSGEGEPRILTPDQVVYWWGIDPHTEYGPPESSPAKAALQAARVLNNTDQFASAFFERGAVKATILAVPQGTPEREKTRLEKWFTSVVQGVKNAFSAKAINADAVKVQTVGEGIEGLENTELTREKREDIATALGVYQSQLWSTSATDSNRKMDTVDFLKHTAVPQHELIAEVLNAQKLEDMGYRWVPRPDKLDEFQENENERGEAFLSYVSAMGREKSPIVGEMLGLDLPEKYDYEDLAPEEKEIEEEEPESPQEAREIIIEDEEEEEEEKSVTLQGDLEKWRRKALNRVKDGSGACDFTSKVIPAAMNGAIEGALEDTETKKDVHRIFDTVWREYI